MGSWLGTFYLNGDARHPDAKRINEDVLNSWKAHWAGDLIAATAISSRLDLEKLDPATSAIILADRVLIAVKRGQSFPAICPIIDPKFTDARIVLEYARITWAFWVDHRIAFKALRDLFTLSLRTLRLDSLIMVVFLLGHFLAVRGWSKLGFSLARAAFTFAVLRQSEEIRAAGFFRNVIFAAFPYTILVSNRISKKMDHALRIGEQHLQADPYYLSVFLVSALYFYAYAGDTARAELYAARLTRQQELGGLIRYRPICRIMSLLPFAVRGYGHLIEDEFNEVLRMHIRADTDPLINSQFYRAAAMIALYQARNELAARLIQMAIEDRIKTRSFNAWKQFDRKIYTIARKDKHFYCNLDVVLGLPTTFQLPPNLGILLLEILKSSSEVGERDLDWFINDIVRLLKAHLQWQEVKLSTDIPDLGTSDPSIMVGNRFVTFVNIDKTRADSMREIFSSLRPVLRGMITTFERQLQTKQIARSAAIGEVAAQVAHDIRSPVAALRAVSNGCLGMPDDAYELLKSATGRISEIADSLLKMAKTNPDTAEDDFAPAAAQPRYSLIAAVESVVSEKRAQYQGRPNIKIGFSPSAECKTSMSSVDSGVFKRVVSNLLNNAVESIDTAGNIELILEADAIEARLAVRDNGKGISPEVLSRLKGESLTSGKADGLGLGLKHAFRSVEAWHGSLAIHSSQGIGTEVVVRVPLAKDSTNTG